MKKVISVTVKNNKVEQSKTCEINELKELNDYLKKERLNIIETKTTYSNESFYTILCTLSARGIVK
ncbi:hypothetical protein [Polaribacter sp. M15]